MTLKHHDPDTRDTTPQTQDHGHDPARLPVPSDPLAFWKKALEGHFGPLHENDPQPGFWRTKPDRTGRSSPVAIWRHEGRLYALRDGRPVEPCDVWTWCCERPIPYELYVRVAEQGEPWPDALPTIGHNSRALVAEGMGAADALVPVSVPDPDGPLDGVQRFAAEIEALWEQARAWLSSIGSILTQDVADRAANFAHRFASLEADAEAERVRIKKPLLLRIKAVDAAWTPVVEKADQAKAAMKKAVEPFLEAEWDRVLLGGGGSPSHPPAAGTTGRRIALRTETSVDLREPQLAVRHYARDVRFHGDAQVQKVTQRLALGDLSAGKRVPGTTLVTKRRAV